MVAYFTREELEAQASGTAWATVSDLMKQHEGQSGAAIVYSKLQENDINVMNGYSGGATLPLLDQFHVDNPHLKEVRAKEPIWWIMWTDKRLVGITI